MAEHRARRQGSASGAVRAADLLARFDAGPQPGAHRRRAVQPGLCAAALAGAGSSGLTLALPRLPSLPPLPALPSARTGKTLIAAVSTGAIGVTAAIVATSGPAAFVAPEQGPQQAGDLQLAANPVPAAAAFALPSTKAPDAAPATAPVTGAAVAATAPLVAVPTAASPAPATATDTTVDKSTVDKSTAATTATDKTATGAADAAPSPATGATRAPAASAPAGTDTSAFRDATERAANAAENAAAKSAGKQVKPDSTPKVAAGSSAGAKALAFAKSQIGTPYRYGATGPNAYDCSGLVMTAFKKAGITLPRTSAAQSKVGTPVSRDELKPGDLVFFYSPVSHVGIYLGGGKMVHASTSGEPVKISDIGRRPLHNARRV